MRINSCSSVSSEETALRKKWKYLREKFACEYSKRPISNSGNAAGSCHPSKWPFFQQLMFLKDIVVQTRASSGSIATTAGDPTVPSADSGPTLHLDVDDDIDDTASQYSLDSTMASVSNPIEEAVESPSSPDTQEPFTIDTPQRPQVAGPSAQPRLSAKRKRKSQEVDYYMYQRMCTIEEKKLEMLANKVFEKRADAQREDEDLMFLKTLLPHIRKIPENMKLRFQSRIQSVVEEFAYGPPHDHPHTAAYEGYTHSIKPSPGD
ncbi:transcription factor Adf-1 [Elysia marginata]|uniref:Transcription factor Adf-1 n=1 Tax=Elysia marginata TaxID=1093978 RepID=A0AAV4GQQ3_9GAST|nr:transcription factor Adf-1 [Elysia marginata]